MHQTKDMGSKDKDPKDLDLPIRRKTTDEQVISISMNGRSLTYADVVVDKKMDDKEKK